MYIYVTYLVVLKYKEPTSTHYTLYVCIGVFDAENLKKLTILFILTL
jgi:hypothetical protein